MGKMKGASKIANIIGREILDSRGNPTVEVDVVLECGVIELGAGNNAIYFGGNTSDKGVNLIQYDRQSSSDVDGANSQTYTGDAWIKNTIYDYDSTHDFFVMDEADFFNQKVVFNDDQVRIRRGKIVNSFMLEDPLISLNDVDDDSAIDALINTPLDNIIDKPDGDIDLALDNDKPILQSNNALVDANSKLNNQSDNRKKTNRK